MDKSGDRRVRRTRQLLRDALLTLIQEEGFEALTVQDIIDRADVGRSTFYAHFMHKEDLLVSGLEAFHQSLRERRRQVLLHAEGPDERAFAFSREMFAHACEHRDLFRAMVGKHSGAVVQQYFRKMVVELVREDVRRAAPQTRRGSTPTEAVVQYVAGGLFGLLMWWMDGNMELGIEEVDTLFRGLAVPVLRTVQD